jgi:hypothetical protein
MVIITMNGIAFSDVLTNADTRSPRHQEFAGRDGHFALVDELVQPAAG